MPPRPLTSSLSPQRWSRTSCAVSARCCESWTATTPPASMTEVRSWGQHCCHPHRAPVPSGPLSDDTRGHEVTSGSSAPSNLPLEVPNICQLTGASMQQRRCFPSLLHMVPHSHLRRGSSTGAGHEMSEPGALFPALTPTHPAAPSSSLIPEFPSPSLRGYCFATHGSAPC